LAGSEELRDDISFVGLAHRQWLIDTLNLYHKRGLVFLTTGTTVVDGTATFFGAASRDSIGLSFRAERNHLLRSGWPAALSRRLLILSGDDHRNAVYARSLGEPARTNFTVSTYTGPRDNSPRIWYDVCEMKVMSGDFGPVSGTGRTFGAGDLFAGSDSVPMFLRFDIAPELGASFVTARITYIDVTTGLPAVSAQGPSAGLTGDFWYRNGNLQYFDGGAQVFPPDNSPALRPVFGMAYQDEVSSTLHTEADVFRDYDHGGQLRAAETFERETDRDDLRREHVRPTEDNPPLP
jgi:hypothetical protein